MFVSHFCFNLIGTSLTHGSPYLIQIYNLETITSGEVVSYIGYNVIFEIGTFFLDQSKAQCAFLCIQTATLGVCEKLSNVFIEFLIIATDGLGLKCRRQTK